MRQPQWWNLGAVIALALVLAGCGSSARQTAASATQPVSRTATVTRTATAPVTSSSTATATRTATRATTTTTTTAATGQAVAECTSSDLAGTVGHGSAAAGTAYYQLELRNTSAGTCYEQGYAGVSQLGLGGHQIGAAADEVAAAEPRVVLAPGQIAYATLAVADAGNYPSSCRPGPSPQLRVYPPNQTTSLTIALRSEGCANRADKLLQIKPFTASPSH
ncbi:MAG TPA: DUF4232 domain-containing protein [Solirubrobacteraceae bacterium]|nr:DUF4232 domain-containing protein [Solirubrobacteraceae bacterium]